jgi:retron-type reverse transcriptase
MAKNPEDKVRELQRRLWTCAKRSRTRRFQALHDRIYSSDVPWEAWTRVRRMGAAGVDEITLRAIEEKGVGQFLERIEADLKVGQYRQQPVRRRYLPKADGKSGHWGYRRYETELVQMVAKIVIRQWLRAGVMEEGAVRETLAGTPQGGVLSPLLANIYLSYLDRIWARRCASLGILVRYAPVRSSLGRVRENRTHGLRGGS